MPGRYLGLIVVMIAVGAEAGSHAVQKGMVAQAEAQDIEDAILRGEGNLNAQLSRIHYLEQEGIVSLDLSDALRRTTNLNTARTIAQALATLAHPNGENALVSMLGNEDGSIRMYAAQGVGRVKSGRAVPKLIALLGDKTLGVRREAARSLGLLHAPSAGAPLIKAAHGEGEVEVRETMLIAVGQTGDKKQAKALEAFLADSSESTRFAAARSLCVLGDKKGLEFAKKQLASFDRFERLRGALLFEGARAKDAAPVLEPLLDDADASVAATAGRLLYQGGDEKKLDWLVLRSFQSMGDKRLAYEKELETLRLPDDQRKAILAKQGIK